METKNAIKLVTELKNNRMLPKYNEHLLAEVSQEINMEFQKINQTMR